jgi:hypothetical protein
MTKVKEETLFLTENSKHLFDTIDFSDTFSTSNHSNTIEEIAKLIFDTSPKWISNLFRIRNWIVKFFGLKTSVPADYHTKFELGGYVKFFKIYYIAENEVILGADDKHLNFRVLIYNTHAEKYNIKVTTLVKFNNSFGKFYMTLVKPFHRLVVMKMVSQAYS